MSCFLYYLPNHTREMISRQEIERAGLGHAFAPHSEPICNALRGSGPDGGQGAIVTLSDRYNYKPAEQTWEQGVGYWVGMWKDSPPTPDDLQRKEIVPGDMVTLGDDNAWIVPKARRWSMEDDPAAWPQPDIELERRIVFKADSQGRHRPFYGAVVPKLAELWGLAETDLKMRYGIASEDEQKTWGEDVYANALRVLQFNYALGPVECNLLGLFVTGTYQAIFDALGDWHTWRAFMDQKKRTQDALPSSSSGPGDTPPSIDPP